MDVFFGKVKNPCEDCVNGECTMNCSGREPSDEKDPQKVDDWRELAARWLESEADTETNSLHCGDNAITIDRTHRVAGILRNAAKRIRSVRLQEEGDGK